MIVSDEIQVVTLTGTPRERGRVHGEALRTSIARGMQGWKENIQRTTGLQPDEYLERFVASTDFLPAIERWTPHLLDEAERIAARVAIVHRGRLVALGSPSELAGASRGLTFTVERPIDATALASTLGVDVNETRDGYRVDGVEPDAALIVRLTAWLAEKNVRLRRLDVGTPTLEDVYMELTK